MLKHVTGDELSVTDFANSAVTEEGANPVDVCNHSLKMGLSEHEIDELANCSEHCHYMAGYKYIISAFFGRLGKLVCHPASYLILSN